MLQQMNAQTSSDNRQLIAQAETMVNAFKETQSKLNDLRKTPDPVNAPASIQSTVNGMCDYRRASGVSCVAPRPSSKPNVQ